MPYYNLFSKDYFDARDRFLNEASNNNYIINSYLNPYLGPENKNIYLDTAYINPNSSKNLMIIISGTHGAEGYCGSAIQLGLLQSQHMNEINSAILLIHAHNPFGFAWDLRFNENNIDLNRNYVSDFSQLPVNSGFEKIKDWAVPQSLDENSVSLSLKKLMNYARENTYSKLQKALTSGQYKYENGVYFGGFKQSWSNKIINEIFNKYIFLHKNIVIIDYHTGLGDYGKYEIITSLDKRDKNFAIMQNIWGKKVHSAASLNSNAGLINGSLEGYVLKQYQSKNIIYATPEFGTIDPISVFTAALGASWAIKNCDLNSRKAIDIRQLNRDTFSPEDKNWQENVVTQGLDIIVNANQYFAIKN